MAAARELPTHWALALPAEPPVTVVETLRQLSQHAKDKAVKSGKRKFLGELSQFDVPDQLQVGTLDSLLRIADKLDGLFLSSAQCLKGHEHQVGWSEPSATPAPGAAAASAGGLRKPAPKPLMVDSTPVNEWIRRHFRWDAAQYDPREALTTVADRIRDTVATLDRQRREQVAAVAQARAHMVQAAKATAATDLASKPLAWVLTTGVIDDTSLASRFFDFGSTPGDAWAGPLRSEFIVIKPDKETEFLAMYESLAAGAVKEALSHEGASATADATGAGATNGARASRAGAPASDVPRSPVVPRSAFKILEQAVPGGSGREALYMITILASFVEQFRTAAAREGRGIFTVNTDLDDDLHQRAAVRERLLGAAAADDHTSAAEAAEAAIEASKLDAATTLANRQAMLADGVARLERDSQARYEEALRTHLHVIAVQLFVDSVLKYGLPVRYAYAIVRPKGAAEAKQLQKQLAEAYADVIMTDSGDAEPAAASGSASAAAVRLPFVNVPCTFQAEA